MPDGMKIVAKPEGRNPGPVGDDGEQGKNEGGIVIYLQKGNGYGATREEVARVAFDRTNSKNPDVPFDEQLKDVVERARTIVRAMDELFAEAGELL